MIRELLLLLKCTNAGSDDIETIPIMAAELNFHINRLKNCAIRLVNSAHVVNLTRGWLRCFIPKSFHS